MKLNFFIQPLLLLFCLPSLCYSQASVVTVNTVEELLGAIASYRTIELKPGKYDISQALDKSPHQYYRFEEAYDGAEIVITGVENLRIIGSKNRKSELITQPQYGNVITFVECKSILIENVTAGHGPEKGQCTGGVFKFRNSHDITINNCDLYGSGIEGITAEEVSNLKCTNSIIRECTYGILSLRNCVGVSFESCIFNDNKEFDLVNIVDCVGVQFSGCEFSSNVTGGTWSGADYAIFSNVKSAGITVNNCVFRYNTAQYFAASNNGINILNSSFESNQFTKGNIKE